MSLGDYDFTPKTVSKQTFRWAPVVAFVGCVAVVVVGVIMLLGWTVGGWFQEHNIQRHYSQTVSSQAYQQSLEAELSQHLTNISTVAMERDSVPAGSPEQVNLRASQLSEVRIFCEQSVNFLPQVVGLSGQQLQAEITANCNAGAMVPSPPLANPVPAQ